jgi:CelD/BcsL family acetyltransferase involved in cellulose biosynthesis
MLRVEEVSGVEGVLHLEQVWNTLCHESQCSSFFLSHDWFRCCVAGLAPDCEALTLLVCDGPSVIGIAPLLLQRTRWRLFPARVLTLMHNQDSPYCDLITHPARTDAVLHAIMAHLHGRSDWHLWSALRIDRSSPTSGVLTAMFGTSASLRTPSERSLVLRLDGGWQHFWNAQSQRFKKTVRNVSNRVERLGHIEVRDEALTEPAPHCMEVFRAVAGKSWKATLPISVTRNHNIARFFETLTVTLHAAHRLALWVLRVDGEPVATEYQVLDGQTV